MEDGVWRPPDSRRRRASLYTGPVNFMIKMRNELQGTDTTLFTGKMKVGKARSNEQGRRLLTSLSTSWTTIGTFRSVTST